MAAKMEGYLKLKADTSVLGMHTWKRRYVVLDAAKHLITLYQSKEDYSTASSKPGVRLGGVSNFGLRDIVKAEQLLDKKGGARFDVQTATSDHDLLQFLADSKDQAHKWVSAIVSARLDKTSASVSSSTNNYAAKSQTQSDQEDRKSQEKEQDAEAAEEVVAAVQRVKARKGSMAENEVDGCIEIELVSGHNLPPMDLNGRSDPYVEFELGKTTVRSSVQEETLSPVWEEKHRIPVRRAQLLGPMTFKVWDRDTIGSDEFMGEGSVSLEHLLGGEAQRIELQLLDKKGKPLLCGAYIIVELQYLEGEDVDGKPGTRTPTPVPEEVIEEHAEAVEAFQKTPAKKKKKKKRSKDKGASDMDSGAESSSLSSKAVSRADDSRTPSHQQTEAEDSTKARQPTSEWVDATQLERPIDNLGDFSGYLVHLTAHLQSSMSTTVTMPDITLEEQDYKDDKEHHREYADGHDRPERNGADTQTGATTSVLRWFQIKDDTLMYFNSHADGQSKPEPDGFFVISNMSDIELDPSEAETIRKKSSQSAKAAKAKHSMQGGVDQLLDDTQDEMAREFTVRLAAENQVHRFKVPEMEVVSAESWVSALTEARDHIQRQKDGYKSPTPRPEDSRHSRDHSDDDLKIVGGESDPCCSCCIIS